MIPLSKSQIAIDFAHKMHHEYPHMSVFWIHATSIDRFREECHSIADKCDIPGRNDSNCNKILLVKKWLEKEHKDWLMIIDNTDEVDVSQTDSKTEDASILEYLPRSPHGSILMTTRNRTAGYHFTENDASSLIEVKVMTEEESCRLLKPMMTSSQYPSDSKVLKLAGLLGYLPLALAQAAAFMQENVLAIGKYIELYNHSDENRMELLSEPFEASGRDSRIPNSVAATIILTINKIKELDPNAIEILCLVAFVDKNDIPKRLLHGTAKRSFEFHRSLGILKAFSLILEDNQGNLFIHQLVQVVIRKWLIIENIFESKASRVMDIIAELFPNATLENWSVCTTYLPHARAVLRHLPNLQGGQLRRRFYLQEGIAYYLWTQGYHDEAEELDLLIVEESKREFGPENPETLESIAGLASTYESQGKWPEAAKLDQHVVEIREKSLGPIHPLTLTSKSNLASAYSRQGRLAEAESLMLEVLEMHKSLSGANHEDTIDAIASLGFVYVEMHQPEKAEELIQEAWEWRKENLGPDHKITLGTASTLGFIYKTQDRLQEAERLISETIRAQL